MAVAMFPGQGSQRVGMGGRLFDEVAEFAAVEGEVDDLLGYSVRRLCAEGPSARLGDTAFTQPCLYVVNALHHYRALSTGWRPRLLAGHSLGEYNALQAGGAFDFLTGLRLVKKRGELMGQARGGGMAAVLGLSPERIGAVLQDEGLDELDIANFNSPAQTVVSGPSAAIARAGPCLERAGARMVIPLPVSAAFHSRTMQPAAAEFAEFLADLPIQSPALPVISNVTARPYAANDGGADVKALLVRQMVSPVRWSACVWYLVGRAGADAVFREIGPGDVLSKLFLQITGERTVPPAPGGARNAVEHRA
jgi:malonyl CoA-acyl carrier protein transacylase